MYGKKYCEANCGEFRRDFPHFSNGFGPKYCTGRGNLVSTGHTSEEAETNTNHGWNSSECSLPFSSQQHDHPSGLMGPHQPHFHHHHHSFSQQSNHNPPPSYIGSSAHQHQHHGFYGHEYALHHRPTGANIDQCDGNVNELSATSTEHVINLYDLCANRTVEYADCSFNGPAGHQHGTDAFAYNQEEYYCCSNFEEPPPTTMSWIEADSYRAWESNLNHGTMMASMPPNQCYGPPATGQLVVAFGNQPNAFETVPCLDSVPMARCDRDKLSIHRATTYGPLSSGSCMHGRHPPMNTFKECKAIGPNTVSVNLAMNLAKPYSSLPENRPAMSSIQMRTHSKYKLMSQLGEHITIKEHNFTDVYRINSKERVNLCKAKSTLFSQMKHIRIDRVEEQQNTNQNGQNHSETAYADNQVADLQSDINGDHKANLCFICGKNYARPSTLKTHLRTHSGEKPFKCRVCSKAFSQAANLTAHERTHSGEKPFPCGICGKKFSQSSSVTTHLRTHSGERPYTCQFCQHSFSDSSTLTKHLRIHSGQKPYSCRYCNQKFSQSGNLSRHLRIHKRK